MTNLLTFHVPKVRSKASIDFMLDARPFLSTQFQPLVPAETLPAPNSVEMWAAAHDCGYGVSWDKRVECSGKEWQALHRHLYQRLRFHLTLLENASPLGTPAAWKRAAFASLLETTEKSALSYALGAIYCRIATGRWRTRSHACHAGYLRRFWHYKITAHPAVTLGGGGNAMKGIQNPDYMAQCSCEAWSAVEAKGTLEQLDRGELKRGLGQAMKFSTLSLYSLHKSSPSTKPIRSSVCVANYFDSNALLQVLHLDPPNPQAAALPERESGPMVVTEFADLVHFEHALHQHQSYEAGALTDDDHGSGSVEWRGTPDLPELRFGMAVQQVKLQARLTWAIDALSRIMPVIAAARTKGWPGSRLRNALRRQARRIQYDTARTGDPVDAADTAWKEFALWIKQEAVGEQVDWSALLTRLWTAPILSAFGGEAAKSLQGLWWDLHRLRRAGQLDARLRQPAGSVSEGPVPSMAITTYGLIVASTDFSPRLPVLSRLRF